MEASEPAGRSVLDQPTLVLNRSWIAVHVTTVRRAVCMVYQEIAHVVATDTLQTYDFPNWLTLGSPPTNRWIRGAALMIPAPEVVQLLQYDRIPVHEAPFTRRNLYQRDDYTCQYCGRRSPADRLSIDHVLPRSKGGRTTWDNCVLACVRCNARKADRSLQESGLRLKRAPRRPRWTPYLNVAGERLPSWGRFAPELRSEGHATGA